jgi:predicted dehydrogenase
MDKLRMGVIGCGEIAQIMHLPFLRELRDLFEISAICDISPRLVSQIGDIYHVKGRYTEYKKLLTHANLDAVAILTNVDHAKIAVAAAQAKKHIFIEKPLCFNLEEADAVIRAASQNSVTVMVGYMKRYDPGYQLGRARLQLVRDLRLIRVHDLFGQLRKSAMAPLESIYTLYRYGDVAPDVMERSQAETKNSFQQAIGTDSPKLLAAFNLLLGVGSHDANILRAAFGDPLRVLSAHVFPKDGGYVVAIMEYPNDVRCIWELGGLDKEGEWWDEELAAFGTRDAVKICFPNPYVPYAPTIVKILGTDRTAATVEQTITASYDESFRREWQHFHECVTKRQEPLTNAAEAKKDIQFLIEIIKAAI